jgi:hypothetical protein
VHDLTRRVRGPFGTNDIGSIDILTATSSQKVDEHD